MARKERPFLIRNWQTGAEYELSSLKKFEKAYGDNPDWYIATGPNRAANRQLGERAAEEADGGGDAEIPVSESDESMVSDPDGEPVHPLATPFMSNEVEGESRDV